MSELWIPPTPAEIPSMDVGTARMPTGEVRGKLHDYFVALAAQEAAQRQEISNRPVRAARASRDRRQARRRVRDARKANRK